MTEVNPSAIPIKPAGIRPRLDSLDLLRGAVMILMALDHVRDFVSRDALAFDPLDLSRTNYAMFFTRWITHFCAPVFCFLAGTGAFLSCSRGKTRSDVSRFLFTRGLWLVLLELTLVQFGWTFRIDLHVFGGLVIWALGWSMVVLSVLVILPVWTVAAFGIVMIATHNLLDGVAPEAFGGWSWLWKILHLQGPVKIGPNFTLRIAYPLVPWIGVMAAGYAFGALVIKPRPQRRPLLLWVGLGVTVAFLIIRALNVYGDPRPWSPQATPGLTLLSFLDCAKYPPSLLYLLMTLGPSIFALALFDRELGAWARPVIVFGRVPLFYYLVHLPLIHGIAVLLAYVQHGSAGGVLSGPTWIPRAAALYPDGYGCGLVGVYAIWIAVILVLYPLCRWFAALKQRRRDPWLSYF